jgi:hypothetical protein
MEGLVTKVLILIVGRFSLLEALQFEAPLSSKIRVDKGPSTLDLSPINATVDSVAQIIAQVNTSIGDMTTPLDAAVKVWGDSLVSLQEAYRTISAAAMMIPGGDEIGDALKTALPQLNASIASASEKLPGAMTSVQQLLTTALSKFTTQADNAYAALTKANDEVAKVAGPGASLVTARSRKRAAQASKSVKEKAAAAAGKKRAPAKVAKVHRAKLAAVASPKARRRAAHLHHSKPNHAHHVALLETRAAHSQNANVASTMDRSISRKGKKEPDASIAAANASIEQLSVALADVQDSTVFDCFGKIVGAVSAGLATFNESAVTALATSEIQVSSVGGAQAMAAQKALDGVRTSLEAICSTVQSGM